MTGIIREEGMAVTPIVAGGEQHVDCFGRLTSVDAAVVSDPDVLRLALADGPDFDADLTGVVWWKVLVNAVGLYVVVLTVTLLLLSLAPSLAGFRPTVVSSESMSPALRTSDVVLLETFDGTVPVGTVIDYQVVDGNRIHRVIELTEGGYRTKGDANAVPDSTVVAHGDVNGIGVMAVPLVGLPVIWTDRGEWPKLTLLIAALVAAAWVAPNSWLLRQDGPPKQRRLQRP